MAYGIAGGYGVSVADSGGVTANGAITLPSLVFAGSATVAPPTSSLLMENTNTPDGAYSADVYDEVSKTLIETTVIGFSGGSATYTAPVAGGAVLWVLIKGGNPPATGVAYIGATV